MLEDVFLFMLSGLKHVWYDTQVFLFLSSEVEQVIEYVLGRDNDSNVSWDLVTCTTEA